MIDISKYDKLKDNKYYVDIEEFDKIRREIAIHTRLTLEEDLDGETTLETLLNIEAQIYHSYNTLMLFVFPILKEKEIEEKEEDD